MNDINPLGASSYFAGIQNSSNEAAKANKKSSTSSASKVKFSDLFSSKSESPSTVNGYPAEIANMSVEDAAIFLKDEIDKAGDLLSENVNNENIIKFKTAVQQFIRYVTENNYEVTKKTKRGLTHPQQLFSKYNDKDRPRDPRVQINLINKKLDELTRGMLYNQMNNIKILAATEEIKGLVVDFLTS